MFGIFFAIFGILVLENFAPGILFGQPVIPFQKTQSDSKKSSQDKFMSKFDPESRRNSLSSADEDGNRETETKTTCDND